MSTLMMGTNVSTNDLRSIRAIIEAVYNDLQTKMKEVQNRRQLLNQSWAGKDANTLAPTLDNIFVQYQNFANTYAVFLSSLDNMINNYDQEENDFLSAIMNYASNDPKTEDSNLGFDKKIGC